MPPGRAALLLPLDEKVRREFAAEICQQLRKRYTKSQLKTLCALSFWDPMWAGRLPVWAWHAATPIHIRHEDQELLVNMAKAMCRCETLPGLGDP